MKATSLLLIPARRGKAAFVDRGQRVKVINTHGGQVVDTWAFNRVDLTEFMSLEHTRVNLARVNPRVGDSLATQRRRPILTMIEDTSPGVHDTLIAACDQYRYELLGCTEPHDNCTANLGAAMKDLGLALPEMPAPLNLFQNTPVQPDGSIAFEPALAKPGQYVMFRAEMDCIVAFSACPQDIVPVNGVNRKPTEAHFQILSGDA
jgi:uncharacterized protein YcgI (DUF1989 family)